MLDMREPRESARAGADAAGGPGRAAMRAGRGSAASAPGARAGAARFVMSCNRMRPLRAWRTRGRGMVSDTAPSKHETRRDL